MRKIASLVLVLAMLLSVASVASAEAGTAKNSLTIALGLSPNLDPHWNAGSTGALLMSQMYEGLYRYTPTGFELAGATDVSVSEDGLTWTFKLQPDAVWSDGKPVTAADYVYSMQRLVDPAIGTTYMIDYGQFLKNGPAISAGEMDVSELGVTAIDDYTLEIQLENVCAFFDAILCYSTFYPLRSDCVSEDGTGNWAWDVEKSITNGPMTMTFCDEEQKIVYEKSETYWNKDNVKLDELTVMCVDDTNTALSMFKTGDVDMIFSYPSEETASLKEDGTLHSVMALATNFLLVNNVKSPLNDAKVRKALSLCIDRDYLSNVLLGGIKLPADTYIGGGFPGSTSEADFYTESEKPMLTYDPEAAQALLAEAGYPGGEGMPVIECSYANSNPDFTTIFEYLQASWEENLGITVVLAPQETAAMTSLRDAGDFDITIQGWGADYFDVSNMLSIWRYGNLINSGKYNSETFDSLYQEALTTVDNAKRIELLHQAETTLIVDDMGIIPLYHSMKTAVYDDAKVTNVIFTADGNVELTQVMVAGE